MSKRIHQPALAPWRRPGILALAAGALMLLMLLVLLRSMLALAIVLEHVLIDGSLLALWLASAWGWGAIVLRAIRFDAGRHPPALVFATTAGLGLCVLGLLVLIAGLCGAIGRTSAILILVPGFTWCIVQVVRGNRERSRAVTVGAMDWLWLLLVPTLAIVIIAATVPPGILWGDEPNGYDVVEYHLQVPREWYELGRIAPLPHNVFSYFPMNVEMHDLLAMQLRGGPWAGMYLAQLMHMAMMGLSVVATFGAARALGGSKLRSILAALLVGAVPWSALLAPVAYVECGLLLFGTLAIAWFLLAHAQDAPRHVVRFAMIAGVLAGFASGAKLTAVPMVVMALPIASLLMRPSWRVIVVFVAAALLALGPWLVRTLVWTGNPLFPETTSVFGKAHWTDDQVQRWRRANHLPRPDQQTIAGRSRALWDQFLANQRFGYVLVPAVLVAAILSWRARFSRALAALLLLVCAFWLVFTHLQSRFLLLTIPVAALLIAVAPRRPWFTALAASAVATGLTCTWITLPAKLSQWTDVLGAEQFPAPEGVSDDQTLVLVGDARAFFYQRPTSRLRYRTVFDVDASGDRSIIDAWAPQRSPGDVLLVDPNELRRFSRTYWRVPPLPPAFQSRTEPFILKR